MRDFERITFGKYEGKGFEIAVQIVKTILLIGLIIFIVRNGYMIFSH